MDKVSIILGAGMTGLAAGFVSGIPIYEANDFPGGICSSYYIRPHNKKRLMVPPEDQEAYRFEIGGGHWIFGADKKILDFMQNFSPVKEYNRKSSVYFQERGLSIPYPIQNHLRYLGPELSRKIFSEISSNNHINDNTMKGWLEKHFGPTLCALFFFPFHKLYTAGLYNSIAPQDSFKSPLEISSVKMGLSDEPSEAGYNISFVYPREGLGSLAKCIANQCEVHYGMEVVSIDLNSKVIRFRDGTSLEYNNIISTIALNRILTLSGLSINEPNDPYSSVHVLNIGALRGKKCLNDHWVYNTNTKSGFHRIGFYSNVDSSFLPASSRQTRDRVGIYIERAYLGGEKPDDNEIRKYIEDVKQELKEWNFIGDIEVVDSTWIDVAYTWSWPGSKWKEAALKILEKNNIYSIGRFGRWTFQGIADSIKEGLNTGKMLRHF